MFTYNVKYITPRDCFYKKQILVLLEPKLLADYEMVPDRISHDTTTILSDKRKAIEQDSCNNLMDRSLKTCKS